MRVEFRDSVVEWLMVQPPARLPGLRRRRRMPPAGHDGDDRSRLSALPRRQADLPQPGSWPLREPGNEPVHPVLPVRAILSGLRRRPRFRRLLPARPRLFRPARGRHARERVQRQPCRSLSDRRVHRQDAQAALHAQVGRRRHRQSACIAAIGCNTIPGERYGLLRRIRTRYQRRGERLLPLRPRPLRLRFVNSDRRLRLPFVRGGPARHDDPPTAAMERAAAASRAGTRPSASARRARRSKPISPCARSSAATASIREWRKPSTRWYRHPRTCFRDGPVRSAVAPRRRAVGRRPGARARTSPTRRRCSPSRSASRCAASPWRSPRSCTFLVGRWRRAHGGAGTRRVRSSSRRPRARGWTTSRRPRFAAPPTISRGLASMSRTRSIPARPAPARRTRLTPRSSNRSPRPARRATPARRRRDGQRQRGSD